jgi:PD-(D/E)XK endonuclease
MLSDGTEDMGGITIWGMAEERPAQLTPKQFGEIAEAEFIAKAVGLGFVVAKPWGDSEPYDFIVNPKKSFIFWRVQVKSAHTIGGGWWVQLSGARSSDAVL